MYAIHPRRMVGNQVCIKETVNGFEVSIAFDDSCGGMKNCARGDIRVYDANDNDISYTVAEDVMGSAEWVMSANIETLIKVYEWCNQH